MFGNLFFKICIIGTVLLVLTLTLQSIQKDIIQENFESVIPLHIYQTWYSKQLPPKMLECVKKLKNDNPEFKHHLYDDNDCRNFIKKYFDNDVLNAYDKLVPGAYKADLWRYCVMYMKGGIYIDIKFQCESGFKLIELTNREHFVLERPYLDNNSTIENELQIINNPNYYKYVYDKIDTNLWESKKIGIYNAVLVCKPRNAFMFKCINECVHNIKNNFYGYNQLYPTGPGLFGNIYFNGDYSKVKDFELFYTLGGTSICNRNRIIMRHYPEYRYEQQKYTIIEPNYFYLWNKHKIYNS